MGSRRISSLSRRISRPSRRPNNSRVSNLSHSSNSPPAPGMSRIQKHRRPTQSSQQKRRPPTLQKRRPPIRPRQRRPMRRQQLSIRQRLIAAMSHQNMRDMEDAGQGGVGTGSDTETHDVNEHVPETSYKYTLLKK